MTKREFLETLELLTDALPEQDRAKLLDYYGEMIDDRMEEGVPEAEAVAAMGDPVALSSELAPEAKAKPAGDIPGEDVGPLHDLRIRVENADVEVVREKLANGAAAQLRFSEADRFTWRMEGDALVVEELDTAPALFGISWLKLKLGSQAAKMTVALSDGLPGTLDFVSHGGDLTVDGPSLGGARLKLSSGDGKLTDLTVVGGLEATSMSGDLKLENVKVGGDAQLKLSSGDLEAGELEVSGDLRANISSGDVTLRSLHCGELELGSASGDIEVSRGTAASAYIHSASGDVRLEELETDPQLRLETASGDVEMSRCIARQTRIKTAAGDVKLRLEPLPCGYDIDATSTVGSIRLPRDEAPAQPGMEKPGISISTVSGEIDVRTLR